jgi:hypothetical protein
VVAAPYPLFSRARHPAQWSQKASQYSPRTKTFSDGEKGCCGYADLSDHSFTGSSHSPAARTLGRFRFVHPNAILRLFEAGVHAIEIVRLSVIRLSGSNEDVLLRTGFNKLLRSCVVDNRERRSCCSAAKVEAAEIRYSETQSVETRAAYRGVLKTFADLVLRGETPEEAAPTR